MEIRLYIWQYLAYLAIICVCIAAILDFFRWYPAFKLRRKMTKHYEQHRAAAERLLPSNVRILGSYRDRGTESDQKPSE